MTHTHSHLQHKLSVDNAASFLYSGNALFSIKSKASGKHMTFKVQRTKDARMYFVSVLNGEGFTYVGYVHADLPMKLRKGKKGVGENTPSFKTADWLFRHLGGLEKNLKGAEFWHHGICGRCGRPLTDPTSIERGIGPVCHRY